MKTYPGSVDTPLGKPRESWTDDFKIGYSFDCGCVMEYDMKTGMMEAKPHDELHKVLIEMLVQQPGYRSGRTYGGA